MEYTFLDAVNIIDFHCGLDFCRPFYFLAYLGFQDTVEVGGQREGSGGQPE